MAVASRQKKKYQLKSDIGSILLVDKLPHVLKAQMSLIVRLLIAPDSPHFINIWHFLNTHSHSHIGDAIPGVN